MRAKSKDSLTTFCTIDGCGKPRRARMLCITHYNAQYRKPNPRAEFACTTCGATFTTERARANRYERLFCSKACHNIKRRAERHAVVVWTPRPALHVFIERMPAPARTSKPRAITAGYCRTCTLPFADMYGSVTCGDVCQELSHRASKQDGKHRRRARQRGAYIAPVRRHAVYERDQWTCQLCYLPVDREAVVPENMAPTIDHIVALANGGTHQPSNVQTAHFICNSLKGAREWTDVRVMIA